MHGLVLLAVDLAAEHVLAEDADGDVRLLGGSKPRGLAVRGEFLADDLEIGMGPGVDEYCAASEVERRREVDSIAAGVEFGLEEEPRESERGRSSFRRRRRPWKDPGLRNAAAGEGGVAKSADRGRLPEDRIRDPRGSLRRPGNPREVVLLRSRRLRNGDEPALLGDAGRGDLRAGAR